MSDMLGPARWARGGALMGDAFTFRKTLLVLGLSFVFALAHQATAHATLELLKQNPSDPATFSGRGAYSADGLGQDATTGGTLQAQVPAGSTVDQAYLYGSYFFNTTPDISQRTIDFDGTNVVLTTLPNSEPGNCCALSTARATVTSQVAAKVGSGGGITNFAINNDPSSLDGVALVVIFSNPALPQQTIAVLDGGSEPAGDTATFNFASPINTSAPGFAATLALGSGFSFQGPGPASHTCGTGVNQSSLINVNSARLTSCAGNFDDGVGNNGALITVGGVGDSTNNPSDPNQEPADGGTPRVQDDELYNLVPFMSTGDTQLVVDTSNPSADDNLFLAVIATTAEAAVTTEICNNGIDDDGDGLVDGQDPDCEPPGGVPTYGEDVTIEPVSGTIRFKPPGSNTYQTLTGRRQVPVGSIIDALQGTIRLIAARGPGDAQTQTGVFNSGIFRIIQRDEEPPFTELKLIGFRASDCTGSSVQASAARRRARLFGRVRGRFRTRGHNGSASVRGTAWFTEDRCDGTLFEVREGSVTVRDFTRSRTVILEAGESYLAPAVGTVEAGDDFNCGLTYASTLICWGDNTFGQASPPGGAFSEVSAGAFHACAVRTNDTLSCWGRNGFGQANQAGGAFTAVSAGRSHSCGVRTSGAVACWGRDGSGQATPPGGTFTAVSAGSFHTCGLRTSGVIACWGQDGFGQATPPPGNFTAVSAGAFHTCGLRANRTLVCWGRNTAGQATPPGGNFTALSAGSAHACAVKTSGAVACWGRNGSAQADPPSGPFIAVSAGRTHTCGIRTDVSVACWGANSG